MKKMHVHSLLGRYFIMFERMYFGILFLQNREEGRSLIRVAYFRLSFQPVIQLLINYFMLIAPLFCYFIYLLTFC